MGARILSVEQSGPADQAGLLTGDMIIALDGRPVNGVEDLLRLLDADKINRTMSVDYLRRSEQMRAWIGPTERGAILAAPSPRATGSGVG
jgi:S1-C subfamily serine protease